MSKLTDEIERLEKLVGLKSHTRDGGTVVLDQEVIARKLRRLKQKAGMIPKRPLCQDFDLSGR